MREYFFSKNNIPLYLQSTITSVAGKGEQVIYGINARNYDRVFSRDPHFVRNEEPAVLVDPAYRIRCLEVIPYMVPFQKIPIQVAERLNIEIAIAGNRQLTESATKLRGSDFDSIGELNYPGKSAHIDFTGIADIDDHDTTDLKAAVVQFYSVVLQKEVSQVKRQDALHISSVRLLEENGFSVFYAPIRNAPLHIRICDHELIGLLDSGKNLDTYDRTTPANRLKSLWESFF